MQQEGGRRPGRKLQDNRKWHFNKSFDFSPYLAETGHFKCFCFVLVFFWDTKENISSNKKLPKTELEKIVGMP